LIGSQKVRSGT